jgi:hypothetical protein
MHTNSELVLYMQPRALPFCSISTRDRNNIVIIVLSFCTGDKQLRGLIGSPRLALVKVRPSIHNLYTQALRHNATAG